MHRPSEIGNLETALSAEKQVLRLDIAVNDVLGVAVFERLGEVSNVLSSLLFLELALLLEILVQFSLGSILENEVYSLGVIKVPVEAENIFMAEMRLNLNLSTQLVFDSVFAQLFLEQNLESTDKFTLLLTSEVHTSKLSVTKRFTNIKVVNAPLLLHALHRRRGG